MDTHVATSFTLIPYMISIYCRAHMSLSLMAPRSRMFLDIYVNASGGGVILEGTTIPCACTNHAQRAGFLRPLRPVQGPQVEYCVTGILSQGYY
jgi:hypothetical protein